MTETKVVCVKAAELSNAFDFVSMGAPSEHGAYICRDTGRIYWTSDSVDMEQEDELPDDLENDDHYIALPHKNDLELGRRLALAFADEHLPDDYVTVAEFFRRQGAYSRFKDLLHARDRLQRWYEFEHLATQKALLAWCEENGIQPVD